MAPADGRKPFDELGRVYLSAEPTLEDDHARMLQRQVVEEEECGSSKKLLVAAESSRISYTWGCSRRTDSRILDRELGPDTYDFHDSLLKVEVDAVLGSMKLLVLLESKGIDEVFLDFLECRAEGDLIPVLAISSWIYTWRTASKHK